MRNQTPLVARAFGRNPLLRAGDRLEAALTLLLAAAFLALAPLATALVIRDVNAAGQHELRQQASWRQVTVTFLDNATCKVPGCTTAPVLARWDTASGRQQTGDVTASASVRAGQQETAWLSGTGQVTGSKLTAAQVSQRTDLCAAFVPAVLALVCAGVAAVAWRLRLGHHLAQWGRAWDAIEPGWTRHR